MVIKAVILPLNDTEYQSQNIREGETVRLALRSHEQTFTVCVTVQAIEPSWGNSLMRIEGYTTIDGATAKVIASLIVNEYDKRNLGFAEIIELV